MIVVDSAGALEVLGRSGAARAVMERLVPDVKVGINAVAVAAARPMVCDRQPVGAEGALAVLLGRQLRPDVLAAPAGELDLAHLITIDDLAIDASGFGSGRHRCG